MTPLMEKIELQGRNVAQLSRALKKAGGSLDMCLDMCAENFIATLAMNDIVLTATYCPRKEQI